MKRERVGENWTQSSELKGRGADAGAGEGID